MKEKNKEKSIMKITLKVGRKENALHAMAVVIMTITDRLHVHPVMEPEKNGINQLQKETKNE